MDTLIDITAICTKIRVVLDKGHYLLDKFAADPGVSGSLLAISRLLPGIETLIDPRVTAQNSYALGSLLHANDEGNDIEFLTMISLGLVAYAADDALDDMLNHLEVGQVASKTKSNLFTIDVLSLLKFRLSDLRDELKIFKESSTCRGLGPFGVSSQRIEISSVALDQVLGERGEALNQMIEKSIDSQRGEALKQLLEEGTDGICTIVMIPAMAKALYDDTEVKKHFELRVWVDVSSSFDGMNAEAEQKIATVVYFVMSYHSVVIGSHFPPVYSEKFKLWLETEDMKELQLEVIRECQGVIKNEVLENKFLLVLSDVSEDQMSHWEDLFAPLRHGSSGSKVIITSRSLHVVEALKNIDIRNVEVVQHGLFWNFFSSFAFGDQEPNDYPSLHITGEKIARHLNRFPLAGKMVGRVLNTNLNETFWKSVLDDVITVKEKTKLGNERYQLLLLIKLCFNHLPTPLCWCFRYCSLFPKDWMYNSETLIHLWISQGFISSVATNQRPEDIGRSYFNCLLSRSFFDLFVTDGNTSYFVMHRFVHYLAEILSLGESLRLEGTYKPIKAWGVHHLSVRTDNLSILRKITGLYNLRTFIAFGPYEPETSDFLMPLLKKQQHLIILDLTGCGMPNFPELYAPLKHLRYLNLSDTGIEKLHNNFTELTNLQVLNLQGCQLESLPRDTNGLTNLRHIIAPSWLISKISCIGKLKNLQELEEFTVGNEKGHEIWQLGGTTQLGGSLSVSQLENVTDKGESCKARLSDKKRLISLKLEWCSSKEWHEIYNSSDQVLEGLEPPLSIKQLEITGFDGVNLPMWLGTNQLCNISEIRLNDCKNLVNLLVLGQLQMLKLLKLERLTSIVNVSFGHYLPAHLGNVAFPLLTELCFEDMPQWQMWTEDEHSLPNLRRLVLSNCPNLKWLPGMLYPRLQEMHVEEAGLNLLLPEVKQGGISLLSYIKVVGCESLCSFGNTFHANKNLRELILENCPKFSTFAENKEDHSSLPSSLTRIEITGCAFGDDPFSKALLNLSSLSVLKIAHCEEMRLFPHLGTLSFCTTLERLSIEDNNALKYLDGLEALSSLKELCIRRCPQLRIKNSTIGGTKSGLSSLENLCTDSFSYFTGPIATSLVSLRVLRIEESLDNEELDRFLRDGPFVKCIEQLSLVNCTEVTLLPRSMKELVCLKRLYLEGCPELSSLPELPSRLEELHVIQCPLLEDTCQEDGSDWYKISYVPYKCFDWES
ncbi:hypothetical protein LUZ60_010758 [Juncus effusus]|nr:hypothetical protein LUZ60_010758 [Juncus effusus]